MQSIKPIILFALAWLAFFFITEFAMDKIFHDHTPLWKIITVSLISVLTLFYPFFKNPKNFSIDMLKKKQLRSIEISKELDNQEIENIESALKNKKFKTLQQDETQIIIRSTKLFGLSNEKYRITQSPHQIVITSLPSQLTIPYDDGRVYAEINAIETIIKEVLSNSKVCK